MLVIRCMVDIPPPLSTVPHLSVRAPADPRAGGSPHTGYRLMSLKVYSAVGDRSRVPSSITAVPHQGA